jgi:hypothetical protein
MRYPAGINQYISPVRSRKLGFHLPGVCNVAWSVCVCFFLAQICTSLVSFRYRLRVGEVFVRKAPMIINWSRPLYIPPTLPSWTYCYILGVSVLSTLPLSPSLFVTITILSPHQGGILYFSLFLFHCLVDLSFAQKAPVLWC